MEHFKDGQYRLGSWTLQVLSKGYSKDTQPHFSTPLPASLLMLKHPPSTERLGFNGPVSDILGTNSYLGLPGENPQ